MVIRNGKVTSKFQLQLQGEIIPSIEENSIKCLGKWYEASLTDKSNASRTEKQADKWLRKTEGSGLPGKFKAWLFQHGLLPRLMWLLIIYEVPMTSVEGVERRVNENLCRWLRIPPSFTSVGLKIRSGQLQLLLSSVVKEFKVASEGLWWCTEIPVMKRSEMQASSQDQDASGQLTHQLHRPRACWSWRTSSGTHAWGDKDSGPTTSSNEGKQSQDRGEAEVRTEVRHLEDERRRSKSVELGSQGAWTKWDLPKRIIMCPELWRLEPFRISFLLRSVYDTLPTRTNLHRWAHTGGVQYCT